MFNPARDSLKDFPKVTPNDLRHTAASLAVSAGGNVLALRGCWVTKTQVSPFGLTQTCSTQTWMRWRMYSTSTARRRLNHQ